MATSRTGTSTWFRVRNQRLKHDRDAGLTRCPLCGTGFDWEYSRRPNSPEADHIRPHALGGTDTFENTRTICRRCNQSLGGQQNRRKPRPRIEATDLPVSPIW